MPSFEPAPPGGVTVSFTADEAELLRRLADEMRGLLTEHSAGRDRVLERLFPAAYEDAADEDAYRDLTADDLRTHKMQAAAHVAAALPGSGPVRVEIAEADLEAWMAFITDVRLALGVRLDVTEETMQSDVAPGHPHAPALSLLHWLGWVQEEILHAVAG